MTKKNQIQIALDVQRTVNAIAQLSFSELNCKEVLAQALDAVFSGSHLHNLKKGAIFLSQEKTGALALAATRQLTPELHGLCANEAYPCFIRGETVLNKDIQFTPSADDNCDISFAGMTPHAYYNVPLLDGTKNIQGVMTLYPELGYEPSEIDAGFLKLVSPALGSVIKQRKAKTRMEKALEDAGADLILAASHNLIEYGHAIVAMTDTKGRITYVNDKFCEISKYDRDELLGLDHRLLNSGHHSKSFFTDMYKTIANGGTWYGDIQNRAKDGSHYWVETTITPFQDATGKVVQYISLRNDITDRKNAEIELYSNLNILTSTFDNFPGGISVFTKELILQQANPAFYNLLELPEDLLPVGTSYEAIIRYNAERGEYGEGDVETLVGERSDLAKKFEKHSFKRIASNGMHLEIKGWPLPGGGFITTYMDITEAEDMLTALKDKSNEATIIARDLRQAKMAQDQAHQHLVSSINSMSNGFVIWDANDRLILANEAYRGFHSSIRDMIVEGVAFEDLMSVGFDNGIWNLDGLDKKDWLQKQKSFRRRAKIAEKEFGLADGRQIVVVERVLENNVIHTTIIDVTAHRAREAELQDAKDQLEVIAYFDELTGLANRAHCKKDLNELFAEADPSRGFAIIQIDLDNFKRVNDTLGHAAGDHLLTTLGGRMNMLASEFANFKSYRWGGDEFVALVECEGDQDLAVICEELTDLVAIPLQYDKTILRPTVSLGVARYPQDALDLESLMIFSDLALYKTKELGRDGYQFFTTEMKERIDTESRIEQELRIAIEEDQLELYFQPQLNVNDETITGLEALLRWNHPDRGVLGPGEFLEVAEATGLAPAMGCKVFDYAMVAIQNWKEEGVDFGRLAINLSPQHLRKSCFLDDFFNSMEKHGVEPRYLTVEFLESFIFDDPNANILHILKQFVARGIHVELDDFGTGYASLSHLSTMPINGLKIDRSFVYQMINNQKQQGIVTSLISMAKLMDLRVVCEGVETQQQWDSIASIGNSSIQGYFVAKPMNFDAMTNWIKSKAYKGIFTSTPDVPALDNILNADGV